MSDTSTGIRGNNVMDAMKDAKQRATKAHEEYGLGLTIIAVLFGLVVLAVMVALARLFGYGGFHAGIVGVGMIIIGHTTKSNKQVGSYAGYVIGIGWIIVTSAILTTGLTDWVREKANDAIVTIDPPEPFTQNGTNWWMNPVTGTVFKSEPQYGCRAQGTCFDPNHSDGQGGTDLVLYNATTVAALRDTSRSVPSVVPAPVVEECTARRPCEVVIPRCGGEQDWVRVNSQTGYALFWGYDDNIIESQFLLGTRWLSSLNGLSKEELASITANRFCTNEIFYADEPMSLEWVDIDEL